jgi:hypothetical protein
LSLAALCVGMFGASVALYVLAPSAQEGAAGSALGDLVIFVPFLAFPIVGVLIASRRPKNPIGWICLAASFFWMLIAFMEGERRLLASGSARLGTDFGGDRRAEPMDMDSPRRAARDLPDPALPGR